MKTAISRSLEMFIAGTLMVGSMVAVGAEVTKDGLQVTVAPEKKAFGTQEPVVLDVTFKNVSDEAFQVYDANYWAQQPGPTWSFTVKDIDSGKIYRPAPLLMRTNVLRIPTPVMLESGASHQTRVSFSARPEWLEVGAGAQASNKKKAGDALNVEVQGAGTRAGQDAPRQIKIAPGVKRGAAERVKLGPGTYELKLTLHLMEVPEQAARKLPAAAMPEKNDAPFWTGKIDLPAVKFEMSENQYRMDPERAAKSEVVVAGRMHQLKTLKEEKKIEGTVRVLSRLKGEGIEKGGDINIRLTKKQNRDKGLIWYLVKGEGDFYTPVE